MLRIAHRPPRVGRYRATGQPITHAWDRVDFPSQRASRWCPPNLLIDASTAMHRSFDLALAQATQTRRGAELQSDLPNSPPSMRSQLPAAPRVHGSLLVLCQDGRYD